MYLQESSESKFSWRGDFPNHLDEKAHRLQCLLLAMQLLLQNVLRTLHLIMMDMND